MKASSLWARRFWAWLTKTRWPGWRGAGHLAVTGLLVQGCYLGGVFYAIDQGMSAGVVSLIVGLQPLLTALAAVLFLGIVFALVAAV